MFSDRLKTLRVEHKLTQQALAQQLNVAQSAVANWESNNRMPDFVMMNKIADYFNVSVDWLIGNSDCRNISNYNSTDIDNVYFSFAKEAQDEGIDPEDIKKAIEMIKFLKKK